MWHVSCDMCHVSCPIQECRVWRVTPHSRVWLAACMIEKELIYKCEWRLWHGEFSYVTLVSCELASHWVHKSLSWHVTVLTTHWVDTSLITQFKTQDPYQLERGIPIYMSCELTSHCVHKSLSWQVTEFTTHWSLSSKLNSQLTRQNPTQISLVSDNSQLTFSDAQFTTHF